MKKIYIFILLLAICTSTLSFGQVILTDDFSYADGSLVGNGNWARVSGTAGDFLVSSNKAVVQHGTPSEDVKIPFTQVSGDVYVSFDFSVDDLGAVYTKSDNEYFAHLGFIAKVYVVPASNGGDYTVGLSSKGNTADVTWATDLTFDQSYRAILKFDQVTGSAQLWIDATASTETSISGTESGASTVNSFHLRQSDSSENETIRIDNLIVSQTFNDATTSVKNDAITGFSMYPNPVSDGVLNVLSASTSVKEVSIFNLLGKQVFSSSFSGIKNDIDVSSINAGIYILKIIEEGKTATRKLIIR